MTRNAYARYLRTTWWRDFRRWYYRRFERSCCACGEKRGVELHHLRYRDARGRSVLGAESFSDVVPLCRRCHSMVHSGYRLTNVRWER